MFEQLDEETEENDFVQHFKSSHSLQKVNNSFSSETTFPKGREEEEETKEQSPLDQQFSHYWSRTSPAQGHIQALQSPVITSNLRAMNSLLDGFLQ